MNKLLAMLWLLAVTTALFAGDYWPEQVHDGTRSGRSAGEGNIITPEITWKLPMGGGFDDRKLLVEGSVFNNPSFLFVQGGHVLQKNTSGTVVWDTGNISAGSFGGRWDLDNDGKKEIVVMGNNYQCFIVASDTGEVFSEIYPCGVPLKAIDIDGNGKVEIVTRNLWSVVGVRVYDFSDGLATPRVAWERSDNLTNNGFELAFGDLDGNPQTTELALDINDYAKITVLDARTGTLLRARSTPSLFGKFAYGTNMIADVDGTPPAEFIFSGMVANYGNRGSLSVSVYDYANDRFKWQYEYGQNTGDVKTEFLPEALADLDGDGLPEIVVSIYNDTLELTRVNNKQIFAQQDGINEPSRWVTAIYRASDGALKGYIADAYIQTIADITGDGVPEIVIKRTAAGTSVLPTYADIAAYRLDASGNLVLLWSSSALSVLECSRTPDISFDDYRTKRKACMSDLTGDGILDLTAIRDVNGDGKPEEMVVLSAPFDTPILSRVTILQNDEEAQVIHAEAGALCISRTSGVAECYDLSGPSPRRVTAIPANNFMGNAVVFPLRNGVRLLTTDARKRLLLLDPMKANPKTAPLLLWSLSNTVPQELFAVQPTLGADYYVLRKTVSATNDPRIELRSVTGDLVWGRDFAGAMMQPTSFGSGNFGGSSSRDIATFIDLGGNRPAVLVFEANDGNLVMSFENPDTSLYQKATLVTVPNLPGTDRLFVINPIDGELLDPSTASRLTLLKMGWLNYYGFAADLDGDGAYELYSNPIFDQKRFMRTNNTILWDLPFGKTSSYYDYYMNFAGLADIDENPGLDVALGGQYGDLSAYSGLDGTVLWKRCLYLGMSIELPLDSFLTREDCPGAKLSNIASGDIDSDGLEEFVVGSPDGYLYVINTEDGSLAWSWLFDYAVGHPILADVDADGKIEIVVGVADGYLYALDQKKHTKPFAVREVVIKNGKVQNVGTDIDTQDYAGRIGVAWSPMFNAKGYEIRVVDAMGTVVSETVTVTNGFSMIISDADIVTGQTYFAEVRGYDKDGYYSDWNRGDGVTVNVTAPKNKSLFEKMKNLFR